MHMHACNVQFILDVIAIAQLIDRSSLTVLILGRYTVLVTCVSACARTHTARAHVHVITGEHMRAHRHGSHLSRHDVLVDMPEYFELATCRHQEVWCHRYERATLGIVFRPLLWAECHSTCHSMIIHILGPKVAWPVVS